MSERREIREYIATLLENNLIGTGKPVQKVYSYQVGDFGGRSPVVTVTSHGTDYAKTTVRTSRAVHWVNMHTFVVYAGAHWTEKNCEDALDRIQYEAVALLLDLDDAPYSITVDGPSQTGSVVIGGKEYRTEVVRLRVVKNG